MAAIVYLLHYARPYGNGRHYLGVAASEGEIPQSGVPHGRGVRSSRASGQLADVWDVVSLPAAEQLRAKFRKQGSRRRLCSICTPGNARGAGTGNWERVKVGA